MTDRFESILDESISALQAGVPIEDILAEVPDYAGELRPLLYAATFIADPNPDFLPEARKEALRSEYMRQIAELPPVPPTFAEKAKASLMVFKRRLSGKAVLNDMITIAITAFLTLTMTALTLNYVAGSSIPGDFLYGVKRFSENSLLMVTFDEAGRIELENEFNEIRLAEIEELIRQNRAAVVQFRGTLDTKGENLWVINEYTIFLPQDSTIIGEPEEGHDVEIIGLLRTNNVLVADTIKAIK